MHDPLGMIGGVTGAGGVHRPQGLLGNQKPREGAPAFKDVLLENLDKVNKLNMDADRAIEDLVAGRRDDVETVMAATEKADMAFKLLQAMRNKVQAAYDEIKQVRV